MRSRQRESQSSGASLEALFSFHAHRQGILALKQGSSVRYIKGGDIIAQRSGLDFVMIAPGGAVVFADCKSWGKDFFTWSQITGHQRQTAENIEAKGGTAGFICWFRPSDQVAFFSATCLDRKGPGSRFTASDGLPLGASNQISFDALFVQ